jgi:hypothetical protein
MDTLSIDKEFIQLSTARPGCSRGLSAAASFGLTVSPIVTVTVTTGIHIRVMGWNLEETIWIPYSNGAIKHKTNNLGQVLDDQRVGRLLELTWIG